MKPGKISLFLILLFFNLSSSLNAEEKITTVPLVNLNNLEASFENEDTKEQDILKKENLSLKEKKINKTKNTSTRVNIVALDKITAKTSSKRITVRIPNIVVRANQRASRVHSNSKTLSTRL